VHDLAWFTTEGTQMAEEHWGTGWAKALGVFLHGGALTSPAPDGQRIVDDSFYLLFNATDAAVSFRLPGAEWAAAWVAVFDTAKDRFFAADDAPAFAPAAVLEVAGGALVCLMSRPAEASA
jgi:glycogen operon protein